MGSIKRSATSVDEPQPVAAAAAAGVTQERRTRNYRDNDPSTKQSLIVGEGSELFDSSIKRLCAYLSDSDDDEACGEAVRYNGRASSPAGRQRSMNKKRGSFNFHRKSTQRADDVEMPTTKIDEDGTGQVYSPRGVERLLVPQDFFNIPPPKESPDTERRRAPPSISLPPVPVAVPQQESFYEEAQPPPSMHRLSKLDYGSCQAAGSASTPIYISQGCQYNGGEEEFNEFDCTALRQTETGSFYIPSSSGHTTMSTVSPSRKSELLEQQNRHNYSLASNILNTIIEPPVSFLSSNNTSIKDRKLIMEKRSHTKKPVSWRFLTLALAACLVFALAVICYLVVTLLSDTKSTTSHHFIRIASETPTMITADPKVVGPVSSSRPLPESFEIGEMVIGDLMPGVLKRSSFYLQRDSYVLFNLSVESRAKLAIYARRTLPASFTQYDFAQTVIGVKLHAKPTKREVKPSGFRYPDQNLKTTIFDHYLIAGRWYLAILNDDTVPTTVRFSTYLSNVNEDESCKFNCYEKGICDNGKCICFNGYAGAYCEETVCPMPCSGNGVFDSGACRCHQRWKGPDCDVPWNVCEIPNCRGNGRCDAKGECICNKGFSGKFCEERECASSNCSGHGVCVKGVCYCDFGWQGDSCDFAYTSTEICPSAATKICSNRGTFDVSKKACQCDLGYEGENCDKTKCVLNCGANGICQNHVCLCHSGWAGATCEERACPSACDDHGRCSNGTCICQTGWNGDLCLLEGCPNNCSNHGRCESKGTEYSCNCDPDYAGAGCTIPMELECSDKIDNDQDGLTDCEDSECCLNNVCRTSSLCQSVPEPHQVLAQSQAPPPLSSFFDKMKFLLGDRSLQQYPVASLFNESRASVIRGRIVNHKGAPLIGVRIADASNALFGFTLSRTFGLFDLMVNGGGSINLQFMRIPFASTFKTYSVGWNEILHIGDVEMTEKDVEKDVLLNGDTDQNCDLIAELHSIRPNVVSSFAYTSLGVDVNVSGVVVDSRTVHESITVPGTDVRLTYFSGSASGFESTLTILLVPDRFPGQLRLVKVAVDVEGVHFERVFEAKANLSFTYGWDKLNVYKQKVFGLVLAIVRVDYFYAGCRRGFVETKKVKLNGYRSSISDLGGWNLNIHHRYDTLNCVLEKGDGSAVYLNEETPILTTLLGKNAERRSMLCQPSTLCDNLPAANASLFLPIALASSKDGSMYVGDYNLIRKLNVDGTVTTVFELSLADTAHSYYMAVHPVTSQLYISLPMRRQIWRLGASTAVNDYEVVVGTGEICLFDENCGDGASAESGKLNFPKGISFDSQGNLFIADGRKIRKMSSNGLMSTIVGENEPSKADDWRPLDCRTHISLKSARLKFPTSLIVNPIDDKLLFLDDDVVFQLASTNVLRIVAGAPAHCSALVNPTNTSTVRANHLKNAVSIAATLDGKLLVAETDGRRLHRVRSVDDNGRITLLAGVDSLCDCSKNCPCGDDVSTTAAADFVLSANARLYRPVALVVDNRNVAHVADQGNYKVRSFRRARPRFNNYFRHYEIFSPFSFESFIFNRHGLHVATKNLLTNRFIYNFTYHVDAPHGALVEVIGAGGHRLYISRKAGRTTTLENANGAKSTLILSSFDQMMQKFVAPDQSATRFSYDGSFGLLTSRSDSNGHRFYEYDEFGRVKSTTTTTGVVLTFDTSIFSEGYFSTVFINGALYRNYIWKQNEIDIIGFNEKRTIFAQDANVFYLLAADGSSSQYDGTSNALIESFQTSMLRRKVTVPASNALSRKEVSSKMQWTVHLARDGGETPKQIVQVNGVNVFQIEYDRELMSDTLYDRNHMKYLTVYYNTAGRMVNVQPIVSSFSPMNFTFDASGRLVVIDWSELNEKLVYDKIGRLIERKSIRDSEARPCKYAYTAESQLPNVIETQAKAKYHISYDDQQNLWRITAPSAVQHFWYRLVDVHSTLYMYFLHTSKAPFVYAKNEDQSTLFLRFPSGRRSVNYIYDQKSKKLVDIVHDGHSTKFLSDNKLSATTVERKSASFSFERRVLQQGNLVVYVEDKRPLANVAFAYHYDENLRAINMQTTIADLSLQPLQVDYDTPSGRVKHFGDLQFDFNAANAEIRISSDEFAVEKKLSTNFFITSQKLSIKNRHVCEITYSYDVRARLMSEIHRLSSDEFVYMYEYNDAGYLIDAKIRQYQNHHWTYSYDASGKLKSVDNVSVKYDEFERVVEVGALEYESDIDGFIVRRGLERFVYDSFGRLTQAKQENVYDNSYFYDEQSRLIAFKRSNAMFYFYYGRVDHPLILTHMRDADGEVTVFLYDESDVGSVRRLLSFERAGQRYFVASSIEGSIRYVFTSDTLIKSIFRAPFGEVVRDSNANFFIPLGFKGQFQDPDNGLIIFTDDGGRPYDPISARWMSTRLEDLFNVDVFLPDSVNVQTFSSNDPINPKLFKPSDIRQWSKALGYDLNSLMPTVSNNVGASFSCYDANPISLTSECMLLKKVEKYHSISSVDSSILAPTRQGEVSELRFTLSRSVFGNDIVISTDVANIAAIKFAESVDKWSKSFAAVLLKDAALLPWRVFIENKWTTFFWKANASTVADDLDKLKLSAQSSMLTLPSGVNLTLESSTTSDGLLVDLKLASTFSNVNIRYGGSFEIESAKVLRAALKNAERERWMQELEAHNSKRQTSIMLSVDELAELQKTSKVDSYVAQFTIDPQLTPALLNDPNNVRFVRRT